MSAGTEKDSTRCGHCMGSGLSAGEAEPWKDRAGSADGRLSRTRFTELIPATTRFTTPAVYSLASRFGTKSKFLSRRSGLDGRQTDARSAPRGRFGETSLHRSTS